MFGTKPAISYRDASSSSSPSSLFRKFPLSSLNDFDREFLVDLEVFEHRRRLEVKRQPLAFVSLKRNKRYVSVFALHALRRDPKIAFQA